MLFTRASLITRLADLPLVIALLFASPPAHALEQGSFEAGLYTAPSQLFTVKSPLGPSPILIDGFDRAIGAVTFLDEAGQLYGVVSTPNLDVLAGADNDFETDAAILRNWFRGTFPSFFERQFPGSWIVREDAGEFEGKPAWIAMIYLPHGSSLIRNDPKTGYPTRYDSWRGVVVFSRGGHTYLLMTETGADLTGDMPGVSADDWNDFLPQLTDFYRGMSFEAIPDPRGTPQPEGQHAGT